MALLQSLPLSETKLTSPGLINSSTKEANQSRQTWISTSAKTGAHNLNFIPSYSLLPPVPTHSSNSYSVSACILPNTIGFKVSNTAFGNTCPYTYVSYFICYSIKECSNKAWLEKRSWVDFLHEGWVVKNVGKAKKSTIIETVLELNPACFQVRHLSPLEDKQPNLDSSALSVP